MGFFSWITQNTNKSIPNNSSIRESIKVMMIAPDFQSWREDHYSGYGIFGGKDFYQLMAEINGLGSDRGDGITLYFNPQEGTLFPQLYEIVDHEVLKVDDMDFTQRPDDCPDQGFFYEDEEE